MLQVSDIHTFYGRSHVLQGVSLKVDAKEIVCLLGRNGVGKSTTLKSITGLTPPRKGSVRFDGKEMRGMKPHEIVRRGISYVPEDRRIFPMLTVKENLVLGTKNLSNVNSEIKNGNLEKMYGYFPALRARKKQMGGTLSGGEQQMLTIARGLMGNPRLMLLDEPFEGLAPLIIKELTKIVTLMCQEEGLTLLLVEQNARLALKLANRGYVLEKGSVTFEGPRDVMLASEEVKKRCGI
jgi:branched-chain amino acid transport system ATP-binding protein